VHFLVGLHALNRSLNALQITRIPSFYNLPYEAQIGRNSSKAASDLFERGSGSDSDLGDADPDPKCSKIWYLHREKGGETYHDSHEFGVLYPAAKIAKLMGEGGPRVWKKISKQPRMVMDYIYYIPHLFQKL
jgi:hypothetical protein